ncbi:hypothetical protein [Polyangium fumosum]|uniref:Uncharacterized protein n=1 Tax=Polyangium fumosum TaxID=889272 RepID=A0A4U1IW96_9BACT|nr:hypothetical protein [Polyangium fumosum]TKC98295.1 hypothetical protein E8A74_41725 [Polyangium fumosum]
MAALWGSPGADPRRTLLAVLVQGEVTAAAAGDLDAAVVAHEAAGRLLAIMPDAGDDMAADAGGDIAAALAAHAAVAKLLRAMTRQ